MVAFVTTRIISAGYGKMREVTKEMVGYGQGRVVTVMNAQRNLEVKVVVLHEYIIMTIGKHH